MAGYDRRQALTPSPPPSPTETEFDEEGDEAIRHSIGWSEFSKESVVTPLKDKLQWFGREVFRVRQFDARRTFRTIMTFFGSEVAGAPSKYDKFIFCVCYLFEGRFNPEFRDELIDFIVSNGGNVSAQDLMLHKAMFFRQLSYLDLCAANKAVGWGLPEKAKNLPRFTPSMYSVPPSVRTTHRVLWSKQDAEDPSGQKIHSVLGPLLVYFNRLYYIDQAQSAKDGLVRTVIVGAFATILCVVVVADQGMADKDDTSAQLMVNLFQAYHQNQRMGRDNAVYGILINGPCWQLWKFKGRKFRAQKKPLTIPDNYDIGMMDFQTVDQMHEQLLGSVFRLLVKAWTRAYGQSDRKTKKNCRRIKTIKGMFSRDASPQSEVRAFEEFSALTLDIFKQQDHDGHYIKTIECD